MHKTLIIGLGNIGFGYDLINSTNTNLTHSKVIHNHKKFELSGAVDINMQKCKKFANKYSTWTSTSISKALRYIKPDVVVIATPTEYHIKNIKEILNVFHPKVILCEKPISNSYEEAIKIQNIINKTEIKFLMNYQRRIEKGINEIKSRIDKQHIKPPFKGIAWYTGGLLNNGSHLTNLCEFLFGEVNNIEKIKKIKKMKSDAIIDFKLNFDKGEIIFLSTKRKYSHQEMQILFSNGCLNYEFGGQILRWRPMLKSDIFVNYDVLSKKSEIIETDTENSLDRVFDEVDSYLIGNKSNLCDFNEALKTLKPLSKIIVGKCQ